MIELDNINMAHFIDLVSHIKDHKLENRTITYDNLLNYAKTYIADMGYNFREEDIVSIVTAEYEALQRINAQE